MQGYGDADKTNRADNRAVVKTQLSASEIQAFIEASLDPAPLAFSQRITQLLAAPVAASHLNFGLFIVCLAGLLLLAYQFGSGG